MSMAAHILPPPPLREGDRLTSDEFMRRWEAMPDLKHAELIDGIVYMPSPASIEHGDHHSHLGAWLANYAAATPGCRSCLEATWLMGDKNVPQPDITLRILPDYGGRSRLKGKYASGGPELITEVAVSSATRDLGSKLKLYESMGVQEYLVAVTSETRFVWKELASKGYQALEPDADGLIRSRCFPGLWLDVAALWRLDLAQMLKVLQVGVATAEHAEFAERLARKTRNSAL